jgi:hypothetical protein
MGDRLGQPTVNYTASTVDVIYTAAPLGSDGEFFNCQGNPASHVTLHLDQPLGARQLRDASTFPPTDATNPH